MFALKMVSLSLDRRSARRRMSHCLMACGLCLIVAPGSYAADTVEKYLAALRAGLDVRVIEALRSIDGTGRQLLGTLLRSQRSATRRALELERCADCCVCRLA